MAEGRKQKLPPGIALQEEDRPRTVKQGRLEPPRVMHCVKGDKTVGEDMKVVRIDEMQKRWRQEAAGTKMESPTTTHLPQRSGSGDLKPAGSNRHEAADRMLQFLRQSWDTQSASFCTNATPPATDITTICTDVSRLFAGELMVVPVKSDAWVIGDVHGNFRDLFFFITQLIPFDVTLSPSRIVCLGDYVDRGPHSLQCVLLLFSLKLLSPSTVVLLRGNHEDPAVCGDISLYGEGSFKQQCLKLYGERVGNQVMHQMCSAFAQLPLAAVIDDRIFCAHGGIPRFHVRTPHDNRLEVLRHPSFPRFYTLFDDSIARAIEAAHPDERQYVEAQWVEAYDLLWSDPIHDPKAQIDNDGFGASERGGNSIAFSARAVETFLTTHGFDLMIRAHQEKRSGLRVSQSNRVITVFSSSNYQGHGNGAGVVLVRRNGKVDLLMKT